jgi:2-dehydro-3-deoxygalactonokinase
VTGEHAALIGLDWGTTSFRAYRIGPAGRVLQQRERDAGILKVQDGDFAGTLQDAIGDWLAGAPDLPVLAAGMIGSRQGWHEAPYAPCPAGLAELAGGLVAVPAEGGRAVRLVPGVIRPAEGGDFPDVMRGEETQILGDLAAGQAANRRCYVLPGTHSKWAWCEGGRIARFATYMTGEVYDVLVRHSILGRLMEQGEPDEAAFAAGLERSTRSAGASPGRLLHDLFSARTLGLTDALKGSALASYLSGLLIGAEIAAAAGTAAGEVTILGSGTLTPLYARAASASGWRVSVGETDAAARGLHAIAQAAGLVAEHAHA